MDDHHGELNHIIVDTLLNDLENLLKSKAPYAQNDMLRTLIVLTPHMDSVVVSDEQWDRYDEIVEQYIELKIKSPQQDSA